MRTSGRFALAIVLILVLAGFAVLASRLYQQRDESQQTATTKKEEVSVTTGGDRGPGSLREALFVAAASKSRASVVIRVPAITLETALPPLANPRGITVSAPQTGVVIDAQAIKDAPVFDITGPNTSITGLTIRNCSGAAVLVRASRFHLASSSIESCDVGVDVAENANDLSIANNRFVKNRIGVRFAATSTNTSVTGNQFTAHADAGIWAVRGPADLRNAAIAVHDNKFSGDRFGVLAGNLAMQLESNELLDAREAAIHAGLSEFTAEVLRATSLSAANLKFELTEGALINNPGAAREALARLRELGVQLMLDDFGTGYSSLSHLQLFPFDYVKIDRPFVDSAGPETVQSGITSAMVQMASSLGMHAIAERIESEAAVAALKAMGCQFAQGHFFFGPVGADEILQLLRTQYGSRTPSREPRAVPAVETATADEATAPDDDDSPTMALPTIADVDAETEWTQAVAILEVEAADQPADADEENAGFLREPELPVSPEPAAPSAREEPKHEDQEDETQSLTARLRRRFRPG